MQFELIAFQKTDKTTISRLYIDGHFECFILEDKDRGLSQTMPLAEIVKMKIPGVTAIPEGTYEVQVTYSNRFGKDMPLVVNVPGYDGIRIHPGNYAVDTEGCLLPGTGVSLDMVTNSRIAFEAFFHKLLAALKVGKVMLTIERKISFSS
jgi:hypothetical protein